MKRTKIYILTGVSILVALIVLEISVFENRYSVIIHLRNCNYPSEMEDIRIKRRLGFPAVFTKSDDYSEASFYLDKRHLKSWLARSNFEVLSFVDKSSEQRKFFVELKKVPKAFTSGQMEFVFQVIHSNNERTTIKVEKADRNGKLKVSLYYCAT